ncbi:PREDICTED: uncharacterized protein LOC105454984 [Wasmannia auropunctata]|uniref:uncharacterized protein LOC105454984 n=1 Tax=Wasmannia auropunctata TaxID=64793 RepID=UPI0005EF51CB|nr:PREDICTED: uncharacterized protein LOC105454984 [Wasmannia auropunctata]
MRSHSKSSDDAVENRDCSRITADTKQENRIDPNRSVTLVGCDHTVVNAQTTQDGQLTTGEVSVDNPNKSKNISSKSERKEEISVRETKDKDLEQLTFQLLRYLETKMTNLEEEAILCIICEEHRRNVAFLCGHSACKHCAAS